jgi:hypothetical protein
MYGSKQQAAQINSADDPTKKWTITFTCATILFYI